MAEKIDVEIVSADGEKFPFKTLDQLKEWTETELEVWQQFEKSMNDFQSQIPNANIQRQYWHPIISDVVKCQIQPYRELLSHIANQPDQIETTINSFNAKTPLVSKSAKGVKLLEVFEEEELISFFLLCIWSPKCSTFSYYFQNHNAPDIRPLYVAKQSAFMEAHFFDKGLKGTAKVEKTALRNAKTEANNLLSDIAEKISNSDKQIENNASSLDSIDQKADGFFRAKQKFSKQLIRKQINELEKFKKHYTEELALHIPVYYWEKKAKGHRDWAIIWGTFFVYAIYLIVTNASDIFHQIIVGLKMVDANNNEIFNFADNPLTLFFAVTFPAFLAVWVLRIFSKNMLTNLNYKYDAENRSVMTQTFLALMNDGKADPEDKILILNALFQPMNSNADDGAPPHWFEVIMEKVKKG